ncbi:uncharacterized protein [Coffea arabica]|uniref:Root meristem growth factor 8 n=1 Tax=Coffea arabica TaxID=13443 RepID=A0ABM4W394_COFAR
MMDLYTIISVLGILLTFMLSPCASFQILAQTPHEQDHLQHSFPALSRKLKFHQEANVKTVGNKHHYMPYEMQDEALQDESHHKEAKLVHARKGTSRQERMEGADAAQFFTMDYMPVRRRRPVHNKFVPVAP